MPHDCKEFGHDFQQLKGAAICRFCSIVVTLNGTVFVIAIVTLSYGMYVSI